MKRLIDPSKVCVYVHTWWKRDEVRKATVASLEASDCADVFQIRRQPPEQCRVHFMVETWRQLASEYEWFVRIEDDALVNLHLMHNVCTWDVPHVEKDFGMGFLSVPGEVLRDAGHLGHGAKTKTPYREHRGMHFGGGILFKAEFVRRYAGAIKKCLCKWNPKLAAAVCPSAILYDNGLKSYFHLPALVKIDLSIPRSVDGVVVREDRFGSQPFDQDFKR